MNTTATLDIVATEMTIDPPKANGSHQTAFKPGIGLDHRAMLSATATSRPPSAIRSLFPKELIPGMLSLLAGKPNATTFPFESISLSLKNGEKIDITGNDLDNALQYSATAGLPRFNEWLVQWQRRIHGREIVKKGDEVRNGQKSWRITVGAGSQDLLTKTFHALLNPGETCLAERPAYAGILPPLQTMGINVVAVEGDQEGMSNVSLQNILANWWASPSTKDLPFPKFVYTTPTGANPSGTTASEQRKKDVLDVARRYGILILEDDPYMFISFQGLGEDTPETRRRVRTYWSLEQDDAERFGGTGWVLRFDSFSKVLSAGIRIGFLTGPDTILDAIDLDTSSANLQPNGAAQAIVLALLERWGADGFLRHCDSVATFYRDRRDNFELKAKEVLGTNNGKQKAVAEWVTPVAGMFLWFRLKLPPLQGAVQGGEEGDSFSLIGERAMNNLVLAVPGVAFMPDSKTTCYVRTSFSLIPEEDVGEAFARLRKTVLEAWQESGLSMP